MEDRGMTGYDLIQAERDRQVAAEGYDRAHDDAHEDGEIGQAARCYHMLATGPATHCPSDWPWSWVSWKPKGRRSNLIRAGALYQAEKDRIQRRLQEIIDELDATEADNSDTFEGRG
jgi:hypothetical protein